MPTYNPKQLGEPEIIREINPTVLCAFLKPFESYLRTRGLEIKEPSRIDNAAIEKLVDILFNPTMKTPHRLVVLTSIWKRVLITGANGLFSRFWQFSRLGKLAFS